MKKLILLLVAFLPVCLFAQIKIGNTVYATLNEAGDAATENGDTITVAGPVTLTSTYGFKKDKLVIMGVTPDAQINFSADDARMGFEKSATVNNPTIIIRDLTIVGTPRRQRQMWVSDACHAIFINDTIRDCYNQGGDEHGGAFLLVGTSTTELRNCYVANNKSNKNGGVFWIVDQANVITRNSVFINNYAQYQDQDGKGAVFAINGSHPNCYAENCAFLNNTSDGHGGVAWIEGVTNMNFVNCTFSGNYAAGNSGTIGFWDGGTAGLINCTVTNNSCGGNGGATFFPFTSNTLNIANSVITGNSKIDAVTQEATADNINADAGNTGYAITVNNSFYNATSAEGLISITGDVNNIGDGELFVEPVNLGLRIYWNEITNDASVLIGLGDPDLLATYSTTDQRKSPRNMDAAGICAGAYEYKAAIYDSVVIVKPVFPITVTSKTTEVSIDGVMVPYCIFEGPTAKVNYYEVESGSDSLDVDIDGNNLVITSNYKGKDTTYVVLYGYHPIQQELSNKQKILVYVAMGVSSVENPSSVSMSLYPNPASDFVYIGKADDQKMFVSIYNLNGILVKTSMVAALENKLDISDFPAGGYIVKAVSNDGKVVSQSFIKR